MQIAQFSLKRVGEEIPSGKTLVDDDVEVTPDKIKEITLKNASAQDAAHKVQCIHCDNLLEQGTILCIECGTNQINGKVKVTKSKTKPKKKVGKSRIISSYDKGVNYTKIILTSLIILSAVIYLYTKGDISFLF